MSTISDVAKLSGLSKTTVSRVINNYPYVTKEKRELVKKAMEELSYTPSPTARRMRGQLTTSIGVIVTRIVNPFFSYLVNAIEQLAYKKGYQVLIFQSNGDPEKELSYLNLLKTKQVDGIIMTSVANDWETLKEYTNFGPMVFCNEYLSNSTLPIVRIDQINGVYNGIKHLIEKGHKKIGYCTGGSLFESDGKNNDRSIGFQKALKEAKIPVNPRWIFVNQLSINDGKNVAKEVISMADRPTAIFAGGDEVAAGILIETKDQGLRVPEDIAIIGFDDQPLAELLEPKLTTIRQPVNEMGEKALELIISILEGREPKEAYVELTAPFIQRGST
ncbi:LacI family transcriptional regulator [Salipaludibacillus neizhouensis]|uniref:LacI family transcriptional regulator n=1 Tax=Salipaludibacillus neizhouensis TaxID=885475 RepID=A0A3A9KJG9_9BACI|nr:LacI family DNA-binding transcriptional regulator [Salipaludibacillus neizhouensis]RKL67895.1 LacI family transcriptional regulator [Salipaludibacillus neizhouensis]